MNLYSFYFNVVPKAYADSTRFTKAGIAYKPKEHREYQTSLMMRFHHSIPYRAELFPLDGPLLAAWVYYMPRIKKNEKIDTDKNLFHYTKPDVDNLGKAVQDVIQHDPISEIQTKRVLKRLGLITNDSRIAVSISEKIYVKKDQKPKIRLFLWELKNNSKSLPLTAIILKDLVLGQNTSEENGKTE